MKSSTTLLACALLGFGLVQGSTVNVNVNFEKYKSGTTNIQSYGILFPGFQIASPNNNAKRFLETAGGRKYARTTSTATTSHTISYNGTYVTPGGGRISSLDLTTLYFGCAKPTSSLSHEVPIQCTLTVSGDCEIPVIFSETFYLSTTTGGQPLVALSHNANPNNVCAGYQFTVNGTGTAPAILYLDNLGIAETIQS